MAEVAWQIPLQAGNPTTPLTTPQQTMSMQEMQLRMQALRQQQQQQNALRGLLSQPGAIDQNSGLPTPNALKDLWRVDPETALGITKGIIQTEGARSLNTYRQSEMAGKLNEDIRKAYVDAGGVYDESLKSMPPDKAAQRATELLNDRLAPLRKSGMLAPGQTIPSQFDPNVYAGLKFTPEQRVANERGRYGEPVELTVEQDGKTVKKMGRLDKDTGRYVTLGGGMETIDPKSVRKIGTSGTMDPSDPQIESTAKAISEYRQAPLTGYALRSPGAQAVMAKVLELNPDYQATRYPEVAKAMKDFGTGPQGNTARFLNVGIDHLDSLNELVTALNNGDIPAVNRLGNFVKTQFGLSSAPNTFEAAKSIVGTEIVKAVAGGASALGDREEARKPIDAAKTPKQLADVIAEYKRLMAGQLGGLEGQYQDATGFGPDSPFAFRKKLNPKTIAELDSARTPNASKGAPSSSPGAKGEASAPIPPKQQAQALPPEAASKLQEGVATTFSNGQVWTIENGKPRQVK